MYWYQTNHGAQICKKLKRNDKNEKLQYAWESEINRAMAFWNDCANFKMVRHNIKSVQRIGWTVY